VWLATSAGISAAPAKADGYGVAAYRTADVLLSPDCMLELARSVDRPLLSAVQRSVLGVSTPSAVSTVRSATAGTPPAALAQLSYQPSTSISRTLHQQLADRLRLRDPDLSVLIRSRLLSGTFWQDYSAMLAQRGYSGRNLADVVALYYVWNWEIVHSAQADATTLRAVRRQIAATLSRSPEVLLMSDTEKQRAAEALGVFAAINRSQYLTLRQQNDDIGVLLLQAAVRDSLLLQGVDLTQLSLTARGFEAQEQRG
jgi:hypothetical protein